MREAVLIKRLAIAIVLLTTLVTGCGYIAGIFWNDPKPARSSPSPSPSPSATLEPVK